MIYLRESRGKHQTQLQQCKQESLIAGNKCKHGIKVS